jgi:CDP-6-deoxy-D-xylo-4-hexulose-3-dehydrase
MDALEELVKLSLKEHRPTNEGQFFPLVFSNFGEEEILSAIRVLLSGRLTMGEKVLEFENKFSRYLGVPYAVMVNSGSSANLLALSVATNRFRDHKLNRGDEIIIPAICWGTSFAPIIQCGLKPKLVDVDPNTMNISVISLKKAITKKTKGLLNVHILGNCSDMEEISDVVKKNNLILFEDTCESLGTTYNKKMLGTFGDFGTFSFFFSHHITTIEGGMVVCHTLEDYDILKCLRAHGWSRNLSKREEYETKYSEIDPRFLFVNLGYNLRPMEIQAAFGIEQLKKIAYMNDQRKINVEKLKNNIVSHELWNNQFSFPTHLKNVDPIWFGFPMFLSDAYISKKTELQNYLLSNGIDSRPIISGNFAMQPVYREFGSDIDMRELHGAQDIHNRGIFVGCHTTPLSDEICERFSDIVLRFFTL